MVPIEVSHFQRHSSPVGHDSIEALFGRVRDACPSDISITIKQNPFTNRGVVRKVANLLIAPFRQGAVNHVTGDSHYIAVFLRKDRTILTVHDCRFLERNSRLSRWLLSRFLLRWPVRSSRLVTAVSESTRQQILRETGCRPEKVIVVPNAPVVDLTFTPQAQSRESPRILQVGTDTNKNLAGLVAAVQDLPCHLDIVGPLTARAVQQLATAGVSYSNWVNLTDEEMRLRYEECDLLCFASTYEGFGLPILEAQQVGRPVVTSDLEPMRWVAGEGACLVDPRDPASIRAGVQRIITDDGYRSSLIQRGRSNAARFTVDQMVESYARLYREVGSR